VQMTKMKSKNRDKFNGHLVVAEIWGDDGERVSYGFIQDSSAEVRLFVINGHQTPIAVFPFECPDSAEAGYQKELAVWINKKGFDDEVSVDCKCR